MVFAIFFGALDFGLNHLVTNFVSQQAVPTQQEALGDITPITSTSTPDVNPVEVEATTASGTPANIQVVPVKP